MRPPGQWENVPGAHPVQRVWTRKARFYKDPEAEHGFLPCIPIFTWFFLILWLVNLGVKYINKQLSRRLMLRIYTNYITNQFVFICIILDLLLAQFLGW